jgi:deoxyribodipyrimidine photo-lyase
MLSGVTGINAIRIYNPLKQAADQDPDGTFVRRWVPELAGVPTTWIGEPHRMDASLQRRFGVRIGTDYPAPIVDNAQSMARARMLVHAWRRQPHLQAESRRVQARHGSRAGAKRSAGEPESSSRARSGDVPSSGIEARTPTRKRRTPPTMPGQGQLEL